MGYPQKNDTIKTTQNSKKYNDFKLEKWTKQFSYNRFWSLIPCQYLCTSLGCLSVCLYPINGKTSELIRPTFATATHMTQGKVYEPSTLKNVAHKMWKSIVELWNRKTTLTQVFTKLINSMANYFITSLMKFVCLHCTITGLIFRGLFKLRLKVVFQEFSGSYWDLSENRT